MRVLCLGILLFGITLQGQTVGDTWLASSLAAPDQVSATRQLADAMMHLTTEEHQPSQAVVEKFADQFMGVVYRRKPTHAQVIALQISIAAVLRGSTSNYSSARAFRDSLEQLHPDGVKEQAITTAFLAIGEEVRGPDDSPVRDVTKK